MMRLYIVALVLCLFVSNITARGHCGIDLLKKPERVLVNQGLNRTRVERTLKQNDWEPLRIHLDYSFIENNLGKIKKQDLIDLKEKIMPKTREVFQSLLKVKRIDKKLKINANSCSSFPIPETYHPDGEGVDADLVIFVMIDTTDFFLENSIEAAAIHCLQNEVTKRPIAGYIQFKPDLVVNNSTALDYMVWLAVHEVSHILVINDSLYDDFINPATNIALGYQQVIGSKTLPNGKKMKYIKSPKVIEKGKEHFNCQNFLGVPLEYNGGPGTAGAHWSKKFMNTDYMIGDSYGENLISDITLALFEDSGWYQVDYSKANLFLWGKNKGCEFFDKKCVSHGVSNFKEEYCNKSNLPTCSISHIFRGNCQVTKYQRELNPFERYFDDSSLGGTDTLTDKCPIAIEKRGNQDYYGGSCRVGDTSNLTEIEKICPECACFMSNLRQAQTHIGTVKFLQKNLIKLNDTNSSIDSMIKESHIEPSKNKLRKSGANSPTTTPEPIIDQNTYKASCFSFKCENNNIVININNKQYICKDSKSITIDGYEGEIVCPDYNVICNPKFLYKFGSLDAYTNTKPFFEYKD